ncbi:MAG: methyl-accepting chemotaxis protein [Desulfobacterota bacterium]|nr:methyl-accepting chemotaxis protein [Thermodesulfobacteriota bacterium]
MFKNMRVGVKLSIGFGVLIAIALILGGMAVVNMKRVQSEVNILAHENVPEVAVANNVERYSLNTMYEMRGYAYTEDKQFLEKGRENLSEVKKFLQEAIALSDKSTHLADLKEAALKAEEKVKEYERIANETVDANEKLDKLRHKMNELAKEYMNGCFGFLKDQNNLMEKEIAEAAGQEKLKERLKKINLINDVIDLGNGIRIGNFKSQALRDPELFKETLKTFDELSKKLTEVRAITHQEINLKTLDTIEKAGNEYKKAMEDFLATWFTREELNKKRVAAGSAVLDQAKETALKGMKDVEEVSAVVVTTLNTVSVTMIVGLLIALAIGCAFAVIITRAITRPMLKGVEFTKQVAIGDVSATLDIEQKDEIGMLAAAMNNMVNNLRELVRAAERIAEGDLTVSVKPLSERDALGNALKHMVEKLSNVVAEINISSSNVAAGAEQMSSTSQSMSQGATEQASALEEISSSMNEIASQTKQNAENATQANRLAGEAKEYAARGNQQVGEMVNAMKEISESSRNISKIIKVIDEIAFQTNLLALNAAVEAARAGKHGKGFAVVAEEVRNLAARSAKAAKETAEMIESAVRKIEEGASMADRTAEALSEIVHAATKVTDLVAEIAAASNEQAQGVSQVTQALGQIDQVTQQNTAHAEESASAAEELSSQAMLLQQLIGTFKLSEHMIKTQRTETHAVQTKKRALAVPKQTKSNGHDGKGKDHWGEVHAGAHISPEPTIHLDEHDYGKY